MIVLSGQHLAVSQLFAPNMAKIWDPENKWPDQLINSKPDLLRCPSFSENLQARISDLLHSREHHVTTTRLDKSYLTYLEVGNIVTLLHIEASERFSFIGHNLLPQLLKALSPHKFILRNQLNALFLSGVRQKRSNPIIIRLAILESGRNEIVLHLLSDFIYCDKFSNRD